MNKSVEKLFALDTAGHEMTVLHDDGLDRHLSFQTPNVGLYWFELITWPDVLVINGDMGSYTFSRMEDMLKFFRMSAYKGEINPDYWSEKLRQGWRSAQAYSEELLRDQVVRDFVEAVRYRSAPRGLGKAVREEILDQDLSHEHFARQIVEDFEYKHFRFADFNDGNYRDYTAQFLWSCHAIVKAIAMYDTRSLTKAAA